MITIYYTKEMVEGEPGPNLYWKGSPLDFLRLTVDLHILGRGNGTQIKINDLQYVNVDGDYILTAKSSNNGDILCSLQYENIIINLDCSLWRKILSIFLGISFFPSHDYVEFDDFQLVEDANIIVSSETA